MDLKISLVKLVVQVLAIAFLVNGASSYDPCCSYPCQNNGICMRGIKPGDYSCDCANLDFYGKNCETPYLWKRIVLAIKPTPAGLHAILVSKYTRPIFSFINNVQWISDLLMSRVYQIRSNIVDTPNIYETVHGYPTISSTTNASLYARTLPPVPLDCPTPMGTTGPKTLPDPDFLVEKFFRRNQTRPCPRGSSLLMTFFAQHFIHMFFKTDFQKGPGFTWGGAGVDASSVYGENVESENMLRSFKDGKFKMQVLNGEEYPMYVKDVPDLNMTYPPGVPDESKFALGHKLFGLMPGLFLYQTMWMREHNRVCDIMRKEHPDWDDERIYQTGKLIIVGETIKIVIEDYVEHLANYNLRLRFRPHVLFGKPFQYSNKINAEFNLIYHWHPLLPDTFNISGTSYTMKEFIFNSELVVKHGTNAFTDSLSRQRAGQMSHHNHAKFSIPILKESIRHGRELRFQSLNNYRKRFNMPGHKSFEELTGETEMAKELEKVYGHIDAMELVPGVYFEKRRERALFGETIIEMGGPYSVKGLMANPICSPLYWKPSTFGGQTGFDIVNTATMKKLFCANMKGPCPAVSMHVPGHEEGDVKDELVNFQQEMILKNELLNFQSGNIMKDEL